MDDGGWLDCPYCETPLHYISGHVDHIQPVSYGGSNKINNLLLICEECNKSKSNIKLTIWLYLNHISPEAVYLRLKALSKRIPDDLLDLLNHND